MTGPGPSRISSAFFALLLSVSCAVPRAHEPARPDAAGASSAAARREVASVLDAFHAAAARADEAAYFAQLADDAVFLGTDASERWTKAAFRAYAHPHFARGKAWSFRATRRELSFDASGSFAWFEEELATPNLGPARGSGVLALREGRWLIVQYNLALTVPNERFDLVKEAVSARVTPAQTTGPLAQLSWLAGAWSVERANGERVEELWTTPDGGTMLGSGRSVAAGKTTFFEHLRIEARGDSLVYVAQPLGGEKTEFTRVAADATHVAFENLQHDWPRRITYSKISEGIRVRVEGAPGARVDEWTYVPALVPRRSPRSD